MGAGVVGDSLGCMCPKQQPNTLYQMPAFCTALFVCHPTPTCLQRKKQKLRKKKKKTQSRGNSSQGAIRNNCSKISATKFSQLSSPAMAVPVGRTCRLAVGLQWEPRPPVPTQEHGAALGTPGAQLVLPARPLFGGEMGLGSVGAGCGTGSPSVKGGSVLRERLAHAHPFLNSSLLWVPRSPWNNRY